ncbi:MAG TPA: tetratricopeptide repeat protein [Chloroflexi bacterium]|nr:tetratricopeptide repeat protein [Chloroflexota bacterium]
MGRRKRNKKGRRQRIRQSLNSLMRQGHRAFQKGDYDRAIEWWEKAQERAPDKMTGNVNSALAQVYFRRGVKRSYGSQPNPSGGLDDLRKATELQPDNACYTYHLGLAAHRLNDLDQAIEMYRAVRRDAPQSQFATRAAYPLALALFQQGKDPQKAPVWSALSEKEQKKLLVARAFLRRPYRLSSDAPLLWKGLAALDAGDDAAAQTAFQASIENPANTDELGIAHYYMGVLAARNEDWDTARWQWNAACAAGMERTYLHHNMGEIYHRLAEERLEQGDVDGALVAAGEARRHRPNDKSLQRLISHIHQQKGYDAALVGDWERAREHWETAEQIAGGSFRLAYNLALAYEQTEEFLVAGEKWREALRRRPRRADHPDAIEEDVVAQLWRRVAETYTRIGEYDEAIQVYRMAVKWRPEHLETRMELADILLNNGRIRSAENELNRVLEQNPDYIPALLRIGEVIYAGENWWYHGAAPKYWERVLELDADNVTARQLLVDYYQNEAERYLSWGQPSFALQQYEKALSYQPTNARLLAAMGGCQIRMNQLESAQPNIAQALARASDDLAVYDEIIHAWLEVGNTEQAWHVLEQAESEATVPYTFYIQQAYYCIGDDPDVARPWLERAVEKAAPDDPVFVSIGEMAVGANAWEIAQEYLERGLQAGIALGQIYLMLGIVAIHLFDRQVAERHWRQGEKIANQKHDQDLLERIRMARMVFTEPWGWIRAILAMEDDDDFLPPPGFYEDDDSDDDYWF